jgi:hypothetical protein
MSPVSERVTQLFKELRIAASLARDPYMERETTEAMPLALEHALTFEGTSPANHDLCAQISVTRALCRIPVSRPVSAGAHVG